MYRYFTQVRPGLTAYIGVKWPKFLQKIGSALKDHGLRNVTGSYKK